MGRGATKIDIDDFDLSVVRSSAMDEEIHANSIKNIVFLFKKMKASRVEIRNGLWDLAFENRDELVNIKKQNPKAWRGMVEEMAFFALEDAKGGEKFPDWMTAAVLQSRLRLNLTKLVHEIREPRATGPRRRGRQIQHLKKEASSNVTLCGIETEGSYNNKHATQILHYTTGRTNEALRCDKCITEVRKQKGEEFATHRKLIAQRGTHLQGKTIAKTSEDLISKTEDLLLAREWNTKEEMQEEVENLFWPTILEHLLSDEAGDFLSLPPASQLKRLAMVPANNLRSSNSGMRLFRRVLEEKYGPLEDGRFPWPRPEELREALAERLTIIYDPSNQEDLEGLDYEEKEELRRYKRFYSKEEQLVGELLFTFFPQEVEDTLRQVQGISLNDDIFNLWREKFPDLSHDGDFDDEELV